MLPITFFLFITIQTDGVISDGEWSGAEQHEIGNNKTVSLKLDNNTLYVALKGDQQFWSHLYLSDGERVKVMHASAALDAIEYKKNGSLWLTNDKQFEYTLRDREFTPETAAKMNEYFSKNGWVANNVNLGDKRTVEAKLNLEGFKPVYFACVMATAEKYYSFPTDLKDDTKFKRLVMGYVVDSMKFEPATWRKLP